MPTRFIFFCLLLWSGLIAATAPLQPSPLLYRHWIHLQEEDNAAQAYKVYRPDSYSFPPARGRDGFEIKKSGSLISHPIAAADGNQTILEKWKWDKIKQELTITGKGGVRRYKIISLTKDKLTLKPL